MCGIAGSFNLDGKPAEPGLAGRMIDAIAHRGPDERGLFHAGPVALAHARLSIIDVSCGQQPMSAAGGSQCLTFNGEIFNYLELRDALEKKGHRFLTRSDTEVILHAYEDKGEECVNDFNGQWAFALWDAKRRHLFLSRDRLGVRPLFYTIVRNQFLFASEIKALFADPGVPRALDVMGLDQIFTFWSTVAPRTIFQGIHELPPGHSLVVDAGGCRPIRYWSLDYTPRLEPVDEDRCAEELLDLLVDATRLRLRSDVPVGAYLSGGLDSTIVATLARRFTDSQLRTFSVAFEDSEFDESRYQDEAIGGLQADHSRIRCATGDIARVFPDVVWAAERPILRTAPAPLFLLSRLVRDSGYKVVLTGEGSDEVLGGYDIFKEAKIRRFWAACPESRMRPLLLKRLYPYLRNVQSQSDAYLQAFFRVGQEPPGWFFSHLPRWELTARLKLLFSSAVRAQLADYDAYEDLKASLPARFAGWDWFSRAQYLETASLLPGYILSSQGDRVAMAHAVEGRFPFLDHRVVAFAAALPPRLKMKVLNEKYLLKKATSRLIPASIRQRPKQPYRAPDAACFVGSGGPSLPYVEELLSSKRLDADGIFNPAAVGALLAKARGGRAVGARDNMGIVGVLSTQLVLDRFIRNTVTSS
jgi:asparagine synthase (glutamine-hydrolysing)